MSLLVVLENKNNINPWHYCHITHITDDYDDYELCHYLTKC